MIFDEDYDTALWFILKADKKNRKDIVKFLLGMPEEFVENVRVAIERARKNKEYELKDVPSNFYNVVCDDNPSYFYNFQMSEDNGLRITKEYYDGEHLDDIFELLLFPVSVEAAKELENFEEEWLGTVTYDIKTKHVEGSTTGLIQCKESEYNIHKTPLGHVVSYSREILNGSRDISIVKPVRLKKALKQVRSGNILKDNKNKQE